MALLNDVINEKLRLKEMIKFGISRSIVLTFFRYSTVAAYNWGAFIDESDVDGEIKKIYQKID